MQFDAWPPQIAQTEVSPARDQQGSRAEAAIFQLSPVNQAFH